MTNIERMIPKIAHLITCNSNEPFNELWKKYFSDEPIGFMPYEEVVEWLGKESEK